MLSVKGSFDPLLTIHVAIWQVIKYGMESLQYVQSIVIVNGYSVTVHVAPYDQY